MPRAARDPKTGLTPNEEAYCQAFVCSTDPKVNGIQCAAYRAAYRNFRGKDATATRNASAIMDIPAVARRIAELREAIAKECVVDQAALLKEAERMALARVSDVLNEDGSIKPVSEWPESAKAALSTLDIDELFEGRGDEREQIGHRKRVRFVDKNAAMDRMFKHLGLFEKDNKQKPDAIAALLAEVEPYARFVPKEARDRDKAGK